MPDPRQPEPGPEATYQQYCSYLTDVLGVRTESELSPAQLSRYHSLREAFLARSRPPRPVVTKDEPDQ